jgi:predicted acylesterase/phospholipase RssA
MTGRLLLKGKTGGELPVSRDHIGISYSGGGPLVVLELGVAQAFVQRGIIPAVVTGVSAGSLAGAAHALDPVGGRGIRMGMDILAEMSSAKFGLTAHQVLERLISHGMRPPSLGDNAPLKPSIDAHVERVFGLGDVRLSHFSPPDRPRLMVAATDRRAGKSVWFPDDTLLTEALLASTAIPAIFPWREATLDGIAHVLVDGGVVNNQPLSNLVLAGCGTIYAASVGWPPGQLPAPTNAFDNVLPCLGMMMHQCMRLEAEYVRAKLGDRGDLHEIRPHLRSALHGYDFTRDQIEEIVGQACADTLDWLDRGAPDEDD